MAREKRGDGDTGQHPEEQMRPRKGIGAAGALPERRQDVLRVNTPIYRPSNDDPTRSLYRSSNNVNVPADVGTMLQSQVSVHRRDTPINRSGDDAGAAYQGDIAVYHAGYGHVTADDHNISAHMLIRSDRDALPERPGVLRRAGNGRWQHSAGGTASRRWRDGRHHGGRRGTGIRSCRGAP